MKDSSIVFKGTKDGLYIILKEDASFNTIKEHLNEKLNPSKSFFYGAKINNFRGKDLQKEEYFELKKIVEEQYGMELIGDYNSINDDGFIADSKDEINDYDYITEPEYGIEGKGLFIKGTIRSGQQIKHDGVITIIGDVNPGAYIEAEGSIIVMGIMRGIGHAGSKGDYSSYIAAYRLEPMQLRIGDIINRSPDGAQDILGVPEIAIVKRGMIVIEPYLSRRWIKVLRNIDNLLN